MHLQFHVKHYLQNRTLYHQLMSSKQLYLSTHTLGDNFIKIHLQFHVKHYLQNRTLYHQLMSSKQLYLSTHTHTHTHKFQVHFVYFLQDHVSSFFFPLSIFTLSRLSSFFFFFYKYYASLIP